jgi:hypothetical protein
VKGIANHEGAPIDGQRLRDKASIPLNARLAGLKEISTGERGRSYWDEPEGADGLGQTDRDGCGVCDGAGQTD